MKRAISRTKKIEETLKGDRSESIRKPTEGLAERLRLARLEVAQEVEDNINKPIENPLERGRKMRKTLKKEGVPK